MHIDLLIPRDVRALIIAIGALLGLPLLLMDLIFDAWPLTAYITLSGLVLTIWFSRLIRQRIVCRMDRITFRQVLFERTIAVENLKSVHFVRTTHYVVARTVDDGQIGMQMGQTFGDPPHELRRRREWLAEVGSLYRARGVLVLDHDAGGLKRGSGQIVVRAVRPDRVELVCAIVWAAIGVWALVT